MSTGDAISKLVNEITNQLNSNENYTVMFVDLAKAFDTVSQEARTLSRALY